MWGGWRWVAGIAIFFVLASVPVTLYISGRARTEKTNEIEEQNHRLARLSERLVAQVHVQCVNSQNSWDTSFAFIVRFTESDSLDRLDALRILKPRPLCPTNEGAP